MNNKLTKSYKFFKLTLFLSAFVCFAVSGMAQEIPYYMWANPGVATLSAITTGTVNDKAGNTYSTGQFGGTATFGEYTDSSKGSNDVFLTKYNNAGNLLWALFFGGKNNDNASGVAIDDDGNCYLTGYFYKTITIGDTVFNTLPNSNSDIFIVKISTSGKIIWARHAGGNGSSISYGIAADKVNKGLYVTGLYSDSLGFGIQSLITSPNKNGIFVAKYDFDGNLKWVRKGESAGYMESRAIAVDNYGDVFIGGSFYNPISFGAYNVSGQSAGDGFLAKYDSTGSFKWARAFGISAGGYTNGIAIDNDGSCYFTGIYYGSMGSQGFNITSQGESDIFVGKYSASGNLFWLTGIGGASPDEGTALTVDAMHNVFFTGAISDLVSSSSSHNGFIKSVVPGANASANTTGLAAASCPGGFGDVCVSELDSNGNMKWLVYTGGLLEDEGYGIGLDSLGNIHIGGVFTGGVSFGNDSINSGQYTGSFVATLSYDSIMKQSSISPVKNLGAGGFSIYPNPVNDVFVLKSNLPQGQTTSVTLTDAFGRMIETQSQFISAGFAQSPFNISSLSPGIYFLHIQTQQGTYSGKIIKE